MKRMLFLCLLLPLATLAQRNEYDIAYWKYKPDSLEQAIHMPKRDYNPHFRWDNNPNIKEPIRVHVISSDSVYRKLFYRYIYTNDSIARLKPVEDPWTIKWMKAHHVDSLPKIDFSKQELLLYVACDHCLAYCEHWREGGPCHRNACNSREAWFIREKKKSPGN